MEIEKKNKVMDKSAIALKRGDNAPAPKITAKGKGYNAEKILDIAFAEGVKVRHDKELTDILEDLDVNSPIPLEALHTVSIILQKVYEANNALKAEDENIDEENKKE